MAAGAALDFERAESHALVIKVSDSAGNSREESFAVALADEQDSAEALQQSYDGKPRGPAEFATAGPSSADNQPGAGPLESEFGVEDRLPGYSADGNALAEQFLPVDEALEDAFQQAVDWSNYQFGQVHPIDQVENERADGELDDVAAVLNRSQEPSGGECFVDGRDADSPAKELGFFAKLWSFARAYGGASQQPGATRDQRR